MQVETGHPVTGAEAEAGREDAGVAVCIRGDEVRRVCLRAGIRGKTVEQHERALRLRPAVQRREARNRRADRVESYAPEETSARVGDLRRFGPDWPVARQVVPGDGSVPLVDQCHELRSDRTGVDRCRSLLGDRLQRGDEARLLEELAGPQEPAPG